MIKLNRFSLLFLFIPLLPLIAVTASWASEPFPRSTGQTIYAPAYSHIYHGNKEQPLLLSVTLSLRNVDPVEPITIMAVDYYETEGVLVKQYLKEPISLGPLGSDRYIVIQKDNTGGSGANFIVKWQSKTPSNPPIVETVMIGTQSQLGISFISRGQAIHE